MLVAGSSLPTESLSKTTETTLTSSSFHLHDTNINEGRDKSELLKNHSKKKKKASSQLTKEDKYSTNFKSRTLSQFIETEDVFSSFDSSRGTSSSQSSSSSPAFNYYSSLQNEHNFFRDNNFARVSQQAPPHQQVNPAVFNQGFHHQKPPQPLPTAAAQIGLPPSNQGVPIDDSNLGHRQELPRELQREPSHRGGFQRVRVSASPSNLNHPGSHPFGRLGLQANPPLDPSGIPALTAGFTPIGDNNPFARFQRVINPIDGRPNSSAPSGFRRVPVFSSALQTPSIHGHNNPQNNLPNAIQQLVPPPAPQNPPPPAPKIEDNSETSVTPKPGLPQTTVVENEESSTSQRPFRRLRPQGSLAAASQAGTVRRVRPAASVRVRDRVSSSHDTITSPIPSGDGTSTEQKLPVTTESTDIEDKEAVTGTAPPESRRIVRIRTKPGQNDRSHLHGSSSSNQPTHSGRRRVVVRGNGQRNRDPVTLPSRQPLDDERLLTNNNAVDSLEDNPAAVVVSSNYGNRLSDSQNDGPVSAVPIIKSSEPIVPLTYFTTYTYLTTVLRGSHALTTSRVSTTSVVATQALDSSLLTLLRDSSGIISPTRVVNIGSRTKGATTTIVNLQSEIRASATDLNKVFATILPEKITAPDISLISSERVSERGASSRREDSSSLPLDKNKLLQGGKDREQVLDFDQILSNPQSLLVKYTYYYTVIDGTKTRKSTRTEVASSRLDSPIKNNIKIEATATVGSDGVLPLASGPETVHLGKRAQGRSTTEVNLVMETFIKLDATPVTSNAEVSPTGVPDDSKQPVTETPSLIAASFTPPASSETTNFATETPDLVRAPSSRDKNRRPVGVTRPSGSRPDVVRSRVVLSGRPGQRVRVKPSVDPVTTPDNLPVEQPTSPPPVDYEIPRVPLISPPVDTTSVAPSMIEEPSSTSRRRVAVTVRRPYGGLNRLRTRVTNRPVVSSVTETLPVDSILPSSAIESISPTTSSRLNRLRVASRIVKPIGSLPLPSISLNANEHPEPPMDDPVKSTLTINGAGETVSISYTTIPIVTGSETSLRTLTVSSTVSPTVSQAISPSIIETASSPTDNQINPTAVIVTYYTTTTHTIPFTVGDKTLYTTFEMTNTRVATETVSLEGSTPVLDSLVPTIDPKSGANNSPIAEGAEVKTLFTTFTFFTTFFSEDTSSIKSSEKIVSNVVTITPTHSIGFIDKIDATHSLNLQTPLMQSSQPLLTETPSLTSSLTRGSSVVVETTERVDYSTVVSTQTFFATLYNGNNSSITPIEETKTEVLTLREPITVTRTILPDGHTIGNSHPRQYPSSHFAPTSTTSNTDPSIITVNSFNEEESSVETPSLLTTTRITHTTLTHLITLHSGSNTILSSVEEISPTVVTETVGFTPFTGFTVIPYKRGSQGSQESAQKSLLSSFIPSVSTHILTNTYFTTLYSGTTSFISSRSDVTSSLVTLYVPTSIVESSVINPTTPVTDNHPESTREAIFPSLVSDTTTTSSTSEAPVSSPESPSTEGSTTETSSVSSSSPTTTTTPSSENEETTKNGATVDLEDILSGSSSSGLNVNLGNAIKDIVQLLAQSAGAKNDNSTDEQSGKTPEPVYVPPSDATTVETPLLDFSAVFKAEGSGSGSNKGSNRESYSSPPLLDASFTPSYDGESRHDSSSVESSIGSPIGSSSSSSVITPSLPETRIPPSQSSRDVIFSNADQSSGGSTAHTKYVTSVEAFTRTLTLTTTKVYYTRDSPLTITSVLTTVIPPKTFVSTIIGSRTILGTAADATRGSHVLATETPSETAKDSGSTTVTTTTLIFNSITTTVVRTLVIPTDIQSTKTTAKVPSTRVPLGSPSGRPTRKPLSSVRTTLRTTPSPISIKVNSTSVNNNSSKKRAPLPKPSPLPEVVVSSTPKSASKKNDSVTGLTGRATIKPLIPVTLIVDDDQCTPACNAANKETCVEKDGKFKCDCKNGFSRKDPNGPCKGKCCFGIFLEIDGVCLAWIRIQFGENISKQESFLEFQKRRSCHERRDGDVTTRYIFDYLLLETVKRREVIFLTSNEKV